MRSLLLASVVLLGCGQPGREGAVDADVGPADACEGLECRIVNCEKEGKPPTTISGTVFAPNRTLALHGVTVYVPLSDPGPLMQGAQCTRCQDGIPGGSAANTTSGTDGKFTLNNAPTGRNVPVIVQVGKWRRRVDIPEVLPCTDNPLPPDLTSLPRSKDEGDLPMIATSTGSNDKFECLIRKLGVADKEFTTGSGTGNVHIYAGNGATKFSTTNEAFPPSEMLWGSVDTLKKYDLVMFGCEGSERPATKPQTAMNALKAYADLGGRAFMSHYHKIWIYGSATDRTHAPAVWPEVATCDIDNYDTLDATIDQTNNPKGAAFTSWMNAVGGSATGTFPITDARQSCSAVNPSRAERWVYAQKAGTQIPVNFQFTTPNEVPLEQRCGKVVFSDMHVSTGGGSTTNGFPMSCATTPLTAQEKALAFMFFDIASCVGPIF